MPEISRKQASRPAFFSLSERIRPPVRIQGRLKTENNRFPPKRAGRSHRTGRAASDLVPPFNYETAVAKVRTAEDAWNSRDPDRVALAYAVDTRWRNRAEMFAGREAVRAFLRRKWAKEVDYRLIKELWPLESSGGSGPPRRIRGRRADTPGNR